MKRILKTIGQKLGILSVVGLGIIVFSCASAKYQPAQLQSADVQTLEDLWLLSSSYSGRYQIVQELERRKSVEGLLYCLYWVTYGQQGTSVKGQYNPFTKSDNYYPGQGYDAKAGQKQD